MDGETRPVLNLRPNVIDGEELKSLLNTVFDQMAMYVSRTYGPFGENTIYQEGGRLLTTKDGWSVEQGIMYSKNVLASMVRKMIMDVSTAINSRAGDGTSTGLIAANEINKLITEYKEETNIHTKFLAAAIQFCVKKICEELESSAIRVTEDNMADIIYRIALVSLDWDTEFAGFIRDIYINTGNTVIGVQNSGTEESYVEYRNGYDISAKLISDMKVNNIGEHRYTIEKPLIMLFSYTVSGGMFESLINAATALGGMTNQELVVIAPNFEKDFRDSYQALCIRQARANQPLPNLTIVRYFADYNIERDMLVDFCFLTGTTNIAKENPEAEEIIREFSNAAKQLPPSRDNFKTPAEYEDAVGVYRQLMVENGRLFYEKIGEYLGTCEIMEVTDKALIVDGFGDLEQSGVITKRADIIRNEIDTAMKKMNAKSMFTDEIKLKMIRLGKLNLKMGTIYVGGFGEGQLKAKRDALDDAINACRNAYTDGVVIGGGIAVPVATENLLSKVNTWLDCYGDGRLPEDDGKYHGWDVEAECGIPAKIIARIFDCIETGFINTWEIMLMNKYKDGVINDINVDDFVEGDYSLKGTINETRSKNLGVAGPFTALINSLQPYALELIYYCMNVGKPFNMITKKLDDSIIHPVRVETEVVKGCLNLVLTTTSTNQLIYNGYDDVDKELEGMREVRE